MDLTHPTSTPITSMLVIAGDKELHSSVLVKIIKVSVLACRRLLRSLKTKHFNIRLDRERTYAFYVLRDISVTQTKTKEVRQIHQFHFIAWPDHGTPNNLELVLFHRRVSSYRTNLTGQMVVHCSAGIGRTGTFIGLDVLSKEEKKTGRVDISQYIRTMRKDRMNMVQTHEQYIALHELLVEAADLADTLIPSSRFHDALSELSPAGKPTNQTKEFEKLLTIVPKYDCNKYTAGMMKENKDKNRTMSNIAVDTFRAFLRSQPGGRTDYINAVILQVRIISYLMQSRIIEVC
ncbi:receptor-type tyrosine-protein phosphatase U-like [Argopecten irradians]|uniref:receptor-type tyrosine-protein phosphatase U-like n=1 Tax=Argopecten irradians TaxID=31199 RepID=UPI00370FC16D